MIWRGRGKWEIACSVGFRIDGPAMCSRIRQIKMPESTKESAVAYHPSFKRLILRARSGSEPETLRFVVNPPLGRVFVRVRVAE